MGKRRETNAGKLIAERMIALDLTMKKVGDSMSPPVSSSFVANMIHGISPIPKSRVNSVAEVLQISVEELAAAMTLDYADRMNPSARNDEVDPR